MNETSALLTEMQALLNKEINLPAKAFRRNHRSYELVSYANNITGCYLSKNYKSIPILLGRALSHIELYGKEDESYSELVSKYCHTMKKHLEIMGVDISCIQYGHARF